MMSKGPQSVTLFINMRSMLRETRANSNGANSSGLITRDANGSDSNRLFNRGPLLKKMDLLLTMEQIGLMGFYLVGLNMVLVQINKKGILSVKIVEKKGNTKYTPWEIHRTLN